MREEEFESISNKRYMLEAWMQGLVGSKEFRSWLADTDPIFKGVRDPDVDNEIDRLARERRTMEERLNSFQEAPVADTSPGFPDQVIQGLND